MSKVGGQKGSSTRAPFPKRMGGDKEVTIPQRTTAKVIGGLNTYGKSSSAGAKMGKTKY